MKCDYCKSTIRTADHKYCAQAGNRRIEAQWGDEVPRWCPVEIKKGALAYANRRCGKC